LARILPENGKVTTIEFDEKHAGVAKINIDKAGLSHKIEIRVGKAIDLLPTLEDEAAGPFDMIFIDADKRNNSLYFDLIFDKLRPGGFILADNVLWSGKVVDSVKSSDQDTSAVLAFNQKIQADPRVENVLLPVRDGIMMMRKR